MPRLSQVPSAALPSIQQRYRELQPRAAATLCSLLQQLRTALPQALAGGGGGAGGLLSLAGKALRGLRATLADANRLPEQQGMSSAAVVELLFGFVAAAQLAPPGSDSDEAAAAVAAAALDCTADLCSKFLGGAQESQQMLEVLLPKLQVGSLSWMERTQSSPLCGVHVGLVHVCLSAMRLGRKTPLLHPPTHAPMQETCGMVQQRWAASGGGQDPEDPLLTAFVRLLVQFFSTQLRWVLLCAPAGAVLLHAAQVGAVLCASWCSSSRRSSGGCCCVCLLVQLFATQLRWVLAAGTWLAEM